MQIAIALYPGLTALDTVGPYESLGLLSDVEVRFVAPALGPVVTDSGVLLLGTTHSYAETPSPDPHAGRLPALGRGPRAGAGHQGDVRWSACFCKLDGWLTTHEQVSVHIDMDSDRALLDLEPHIDAV
jgi:hypothetical protein